MATNKIGIIGNGNVLGYVRGMGTQIGFKLLH